MSWMLAVIGLFFAAVIVRLADVQAVQAGRYAAYGVSERLHSVQVPALRGSILDRNGKVLAMSVSLQTIYADPHLVSDPAAEARQLAPVLGLDQASLQKQLSADSGFVYLAHTVAQDIADKVKAMKLPGIGFVAEPKRFEPNGALAASVLGGVGYDGRGQSGLEYQYDSVLNGKPGLLQVQEGIGGQRIPGTPEERTPAVNGKSLELTIDTAMQFETEQALAKQIVAMNAQSGTAIIVQSHTGEVLALANVVNTADSATLAADAAKPPAQSSTVDLSKAVAPAPSDSALTQVYELGSVMKGVTISAALEQGSVVPASRFTVPDSTVFDGAVIHDAEPHPTEDWSVPDILSYSSNVGTLQISQRLGSQQVYRYMRSFGLGSTTGLGAPGESAGLVPPPSQWSGTSIATIPIGQGVAVTPMQMLDVYNTIANGGLFVPPRLVKGFLQPDGSVSAPPASRTHRVISAATARRMTAMLEDVVRWGTGQNAAVTGYDVAGKTGTAQKPMAGARGYEPGAFMSTFVGFAPAEDPAITAIVVINHPQPVYYGAEVAAPVFSQIAQYALRMLEVPPPTPVDMAPDVPPVDASAAAGGDGPPPSNAPAQAGGAQPSRGAAQGAGTGSASGTKAPPTSSGKASPTPATRPSPTPATRPSAPPTTAGSGRSGPSSTTTTLAQSQTPSHKP